jgi:aspartyl-tRNA(Asn)/glutamyl-tRNA(Gln) amidotransferase subunit A
VEDLVEKPAAELASLIRRRELSPVELVDRCLERIYALNPALNAFCVIAETAARQEAREAEKATAVDAIARPLHGIPVGIKDVNHARGLRTTFGSKAFVDFVADQDSASVHNLRRAGAIIIGKTTTPEFGHKGICESPLLGRTNNPWNLSYTCGGSSGGSAAAISARLVPIADGSDGAGSIRIPASLCGVVGFKPSAGQVPLDPRSPFESLVHVGPIANSVDDAALMFAAMRTSRGERDDQFTLAEESDVRGWRIAYSNDLGLAEVTAEVSEAVSRAAATFAALGANVEEVTPPSPDPREAMMTMWQVAYGLVARDRVLPAIGREGMDPDLATFMDAADLVDAVTYYRAAIGVRGEVDRAMREFFDYYDILLTPTLGVVPFPHPSSGLNPASLRGSPAEQFLGWFLTYPFNMTGQPALSLPCGVSSAGLPIGLQLVGRHGADASVLTAASAYEHASGWYLRPASGSSADRPTLMHPSVLVV